MASDVGVRQHISDLMGEEKQLREKFAAGAITQDEEHQRLRGVEVELDQCWDLLRQRDALRNAGGDADEAAVRSADVIEGYLD